MSTASSPLRAAIRAFVDAVHRYRAGPRPGGGGGPPLPSVLHAASELLTHLDHQTHRPLVASLTNLRNALRPAKDSRPNGEVIHNTDQLLADLEALAASEPPPPPPGPPPAAPAVVPETPYTLADLRGYVVFRERRAAFETRRRQVEKPVYHSASELHSHIQWAALNTPYPGRITDAIAPTLPAFRRLQDAALPRYGELTPIAFDCLVAEILERTGQDPGMAGTLTLDEFGDALAEADAPPVSPPTEDELAVLRWLKVTQVARLFAIQPGTVSKAADSGKFLSNGKTGTDRRIDMLSVIRQQLTQLDAQAAAHSDGD